MTTRGHLVMVEYKGDNLDNSNSRKKLSIGKKREAKAGSQYKYFMVFKEKEFGLDGAYTQDKFIEMMKDL